LEGLAFQQRSLSMQRRSFLAAAAIAVGLMGIGPTGMGPAGPGRAAAEELTEFSVGILSTDSTAALKKEWEPLVADLGKAIGMPAKAFYASDYAGVIEAMRFNKVQLAWYGNASAIPAVDRANGEVFAKGTGVDGTKGYYSLLIVHKDSPIKSLDDVVAHPGAYTFGNGDPNSTSGYLMPGYYAFAKNHIDINKVFKRVVSGSHGVNMLAVANRQVDIATNNTEDMAKFAKNQPEKVALVREVWRSPLIPGDPIVYRKDLPDALKGKIRHFFLAYGTPAAGPGWEHGKEILAALSYGPLEASDDAQLLPIRQVALYRDRLKTEDDAALSAADKAQRLAEIDGKLAALDKQMAALK
jgi:phosphonate transport system substrate-binding protein